MSYEDCIIKPPLIKTRFLSAFNKTILKSGWAIWADSNKLIKESVQSSPCKKIKLLRIFSSQTNCIIWFSNWIFYDLRTHFIYLYIYIWDNINLCILSK